MRLRYLEDVVAVANVFAEDLLRHWLFNFFRLLRNGRAISQDAAPEEGGEASISENQDGRGAGCATHVLLGVQRTEDVGAGVVLAPVLDPGRAKTT